MERIEIIPLDGIEIEGLGNIKLGQSKLAIEKLLGKGSPHSNTKQSFYDNYEFRLDFDKNDNIEFIEFIYGPYPERTKLQIYGIDPFEIGGDQLIELLTQKNNGDIDLSEADFSFGFLNISVGIWRQFTEKDVLEEIEEMKKQGEFEDNKIELEEDLSKSRNFWTIGIGIKNYYNLI